MKHPIYTNLSPIIYDTAIRIISNDNPYFNLLLGKFSGTPTLFGTSPDDGYQQGRRNTLLGYTAGRDITSGYHNVFISTDAGKLILSGHDNVGIGNGALTSSRYGKYNIALGTVAGSSLNYGQHNICIGYFSNASNSTSVSANYNILLGSYTNSFNYSNTVIVGFSARATKNNDLVIGSQLQPLSGTLHGNITVTGSVTAAGPLVMFTNLPTVSSPSLPKGALWNDNGTLKIALG